MQTLIVLAHPSDASLCRHLAAQLAAACDDQKQTRVLDLYKEGFDPAMTAAELTGYEADEPKDPDRLADVERLVLVFPTWWGGMPAMMKGWIDRRFLPGVAFDPVPGALTLSPRLCKMRQIHVVTTLGGAWWVDRLILRRALFRQLKWGIFRPCAPQARCSLHALYRADTVSPHRLARFLRRLNTAMKDPR